MTCLLQYQRLPVDVSLKHPKQKIHKQNKQNNNILPHSSLVNMLQYFGLKIQMMPCGTWELLKTKWMMEQCR